jgi:hypothetical protein
MLQYLIRLDDLCPTNDLQKWERFFKLFDRYEIKPIIAVIPDNQDPKLNACGSFNPDYWQMVRQLQNKGYTIGMHGFEHRYQNKNSGLFKLNKRSEFAGLALHTQEAKIKAAVKIFKRENVQASLFIAPAHTFDTNTLIALVRNSEIQTISDGLLKSPYTRLGFRWIPVQLPEATVKANNTWTFNYHPETCSDEAFYKLEEFIAKYHTRFVSISDLNYKTYTLMDYLTEQYFIYMRLTKDFIKDIIAHFRGISL